MRVKPCRLSVAFPPHPCRELDKLLRSDECSFLARYSCLCDLRREGQLKRLWLEFAWTSIDGWIGPNVSMAYFCLSFRGKEESMRQTITKTTMLKHVLGHANRLGNRQFVTWLKPTQSHCVCECVGQHRYICIYFLFVCLFVLVFF